MNIMNKLATLTCILSLSLPAKATTPHQDQEDAIFSHSRNMTHLGKTIQNETVDTDWDFLYSSYKGSIFVSFPVYGIFISLMRYLRPLTKEQIAQGLMSNDDLGNVLETLGIEPGKVQHVLGLSKDIQADVTAILSKFLLTDLAKENVLSLTQKDLNSLADDLINLGTADRDKVTSLLNTSYGKDLLHFKKINKIFDWINYVEFFMWAIDRHENSENYQKPIWTTIDKIYHDEKNGGIFVALKHLADFSTSYRDAFVGGLQTFDWMHGYISNNGPQLTERLAGYIYKYTDAFSATMKIAMAIRDPQAYSQTVKTFHAVPTQASDILSQIGARVSHLSITRFFTRTSLEWFGKNLPQLKTVHEAAFPAFFITPLAESTLRYGMTYITANEDVAYWTSKSIITGLAFGTGYAYPMAISLAVDGVTGAISYGIDAYYNDTPSNTVKPKADL